MGKTDKQWGDTSKVSSLVWIHVNPHYKNGDFVFNRSYFFAKNQNFIRFKPFNFSCKLPQRICMHKKILTYIHTYIVYYITPHQLLLLPFLFITFFVVCVKWLESESNCIFLSFVGGSFISGGFGFLFCFFLFWIFFSFGVNNSWNFWMGDSQSCSSQQSEWSPLQSRKRRQKIEVFHEVLCRLRELDIEEAAEPGFEDELWAHFSMFPLR